MLSLINLTLGDEQCLQQGDVDKVFAEAEHTLEGTMMIGGQEHFYMETNSFVVVPSNDDKEVALYFGNTISKLSSRTYCNSTWSRSQSYNLSC